MKLLVVDWDYFFENPMGSPEPKPGWHLYDWGHSETPFGIYHVWDFRAQAFFMAGQELPGTTGEELTFWNRFKFSRDAHFYVAESNARAVNPRVSEGITEVWLYDAHHDSGYNTGPSGYSVGEIKKLVKNGVWHCEDWMAFYWAQGARLRVRYPRWKTWAFEVEPYAGIRNVERFVDDPEEKTPLFDRVFLCRSGAWTPPWTDENFRRFIAECPVEARTCLEPMPWSSVRDFNSEEAKVSAELMKNWGAGTDAMKEQL